MGKGEPGLYERSVHIETQKQSRSPLILSGLLQHEQRMSVLNLLITRVQPPAGIPADADTDSSHSHALCTIHSKQRLLFQVGFRRFYAQPVFSQHTFADNKYKVYSLTIGYLTYTLNVDHSIRTFGMIG